MSSSRGGRWRGEDGRELAGHVLARLTTGRSLDDLQLGSHEGRVDLRGFTLEPPKTGGDGYLAEEGGSSTDGLSMRWLHGLVDIRDTSLENLDFSEAQLDHLRLHGVALRNCLFDGAKCRDWRGWQLSVQDCSFVHADLRDTALGTWGNSYRGVEFRGADLRGTSCRGATFISCDFSDARLDKVEFVGCQLVDTRFAGRLSEVSFVAATDQPEHGSMENIDFTDASLRWVTFRGLPLSTVRLPENGEEHIVVRHYPCVVRQALARLEGRYDAETRKLRSRLQADASQLDESRDIGLWHRDELGSNPSEQRYARELLQDVEAACSA